MRLTWRDGLATVFVGVAAIIYALWLAGIEVFGMGVRGVDGVVLVLGVAASVTAVVYGVGAGLLRISKIYLAIASLVGLIAFAAGVVAFVNESELMLGVLVVSTVALWMMATVRHAVTAEANADVLSIGASYKHAA